MAHGIRVITYSCECDSPSCGACDGTGTGHAVVTRYSVTIGIPGRGGVVYDRGIESEARIAEALSSVDEECRERLERLLRTEESDKPQPHHLGAARRAEIVAAADRAATDAMRRPYSAPPEPPPPAHPEGLMAVLVEMTRAAVEQVDPRTHERDRRRALEQLAGFPPIGGWS